MTTEANNPAKQRSLVLRADVDAYVGAEAIDLTSTDASPTLEDPDGNALTPRALYVGVAGDVTVDMADGSASILFKSVPVGVLKIAVSKVHKTGTAATNLLFLY